MASRNSPSPEIPAVFVPSALLITTLVALAFVVVSDLQIPWVLIPLGLIVLFWVPGYAVVALIFGGRPLPSLALNVGMIVGFSVLVNVVFGTLFLYFSIGPLDPLVGLVAAVVSAAATLVQYRRPRAAGSDGETHRFRSYFALPGFSRGQRVAAYSLFVAILLTFGAIGYLSTLHPGNTPDLSLGVVGPTGTTSTLPTSGIVNSTLAVIVNIGNNDTIQSLALSVNSSLIGGNSTNATTVPWAMPLPLGPSVKSSETLHLTSGESAHVSVSFLFRASGDYVVSFSLTPVGSHTVVRANALTIRIS